MLIDKVNPGVSDDQTGTKNLKRWVDEPAIPDIRDRAQKPRGPDGNTGTKENEVETIVLDDEFASPNSRWEASAELSAFLGTTNKRMNKFERKVLVRS